MFSGAVEDRLSIRELIDTYADAVMRSDAVAWGATWAEDAVWRLHHGDIIGRDNIVDAWTKAMAGYRSVAFYAHPGGIEVTGDQAAAHSYTLEWLTPVTGEPRRQSGRYDDVLTRRDNRWAFQSRRFTLMKDPQP